MQLALVKPRVRVPAIGKIQEKATTTSAPAGARLLDYFGLGAVVALTGNGMALAVQSDHLTETVRVVDISAARGVRRHPDRMKLAAGARHPRSSAHFTD